MPPQKRQKLDTSGSESEQDQPLSSADELEEEITDAEVSDGNEDDDLDDLKPQKSRQTSKRKIRATGGTKFGATLQHLLNTEAPSSAPLSLKPSVARKKNDEKLEKKAKKVLQIEKKEKEDKARVRDVIGGWGGESERGLRKVAQRGGTLLRFLE